MSDLSKVATPKEFYDAMIEEMRSQWFQDFIKLEEERNQREREFMHSIFVKMSQNEKQTNKPD